MHLVIDAVIRTEGLDPVTFLSTSRNTDDLLAADDFLGDLHEHRPNGSGRLSSGLDQMPDAGASQPCSPGCTRNEHGVLRLEVTLLGGARPGGETVEAKDAQPDPFGHSRDNAVKSDVSEPFRCSRAHNPDRNHSRRLAIDPTFVHDEILLPDKHASHPLPHLPLVRLADEDLDPERSNRIPLFDRFDIKPALTVHSYQRCADAQRPQRVEVYGRTGSVLPSIQHRWAGSLPNASIFRRTSPSLSSARGRFSRLNVSAWTSPIGGLARTIARVVLGTEGVMLPLAVCSDRRVHDDYLGV
jgi:hypothetical protein